MKKKIRLLERVKYALLAVLALYIVMILFMNRGSDAPFSKVRDAVLAAADTDGMQETNDRDFKKLYGLNKNDYDEIISYYTNETMGVEELLLVRCTDEEKLSAVEKAAQDRIDMQIQSFQGYGEEQTKLLKDAVVLKKGSLFLMAVSPEAGEIRKAFMEAL